jgi:GNAT superfamily N-acetyltransferase
MEIIMVEIKEVKSKKDQKTFAAYPSKLYKNIPQAIPDLISDEINIFNPKKNPAYEYCVAKQFLAYKDGKCAGRIAGIISHAANDKWGTSRVRFSRVDFIDDYEVSEALFQAVEDWGRSYGLTEIHGPIGFSDMDQEGMLVDGFEEEGMFLTIYNYPYYIKHLEKLGYRKDIDWIEFRVALPERTDKKLDLLADAVLNKYHVRLVELKSRKEIKPIIPQVLNLLNVCYSNLYGTVELSQAQIDKYVKQYILVINPEYVKLLYDENNELVGFGLAMPSMNKAVKRCRAKLFPFGWYHILRAPYKKSEVLDLYLVGVTPNMQNKGLTAILLNSMSRTARKNGVKYAETGPELETNHQVHALWKFYDTKQHKRRRCFIKSLVDQEQIVELKEAMNN